MRWFGIAMKPMILLLNGVANRTLIALGIQPQEELSAARSPAELASLVRSSAEAGTLDRSTARLVTASLGFGDQTAADVMTPRSRATSIERTATAADLVALARRTGHSRFPVVGADWDDIDGIVHVKKAIAVPFDRRSDVPVSALMVQAVLVPETLRLDPLLLQLRQGGMQLAVVVDEYGGTSGVVTLEDLVEEIVGEVNDEHDRSQTTGRQLRDGSWTVPGLWRPDEVRARVGVAIPDGPAYETVGGWVMSTLGRVPTVGDTVPADGWTARVVDMDGHRVDRVRLERDDRCRDRRDEVDPCREESGRERVVRRPRHAGAARRQRLLRRRRVRRDVGPPQPARAAGRRRAASAPRWRSRRCTAPACCSRPRSSASPSARCCSVRCRRRRCTTRWCRSPRGWASRTSWPTPWRWSWRSPSWCSSTSCTAR